MRRHGGYWRLPGAKVAEARGVWLKARRRRECLSVGSCAALSPSPTKTEARRAAGVSLYLSNRLVTPANCSGQAALTTSEGSHPHKGALCLCAPGQATGAPGRAGRASRVRDPHPRPPSSNRGHPYPASGLKTGLSSACHHHSHPRKQAQELGAHKPLG